MTKEEFRRARYKLKLTGQQLAYILNVTDRTVRRWEQWGESNPPAPTAVRVLEWMLDGYRPPEWPD